MSIGIYKCKNYLPMHAGMSFKVKRSRKLKMFKTFSLFEKLLFALSTVIIIAVFVIFDRNNYLALTASLIGVSSLILNAKGNPLGQVLMIIFSIIYGIISFGYAYYGEMITYLGMTAPMAAVALIAWLKHPYKDNKREVAVAKITSKDLWLMSVLTVAVTVAFYFILSAFNTANLFFSTLSVATSFAAAYLTYKRSPYFAAAYALNDIVLIVLWSMATAENISYLSVLCCFAVFLANDIYAFFNWLRMRRRQEEGTVG